MAVVEVHATGERFEGVTGALLGYYQGEANTVGGFTIDGVEYPAKADVPEPAVVAAGEAFDPADCTVDEVKDYLAGATPVEQERVIAAERGGKARVSLLGEPQDS
jgi:hypothetical protein